MPQNKSEPIYIRFFLYVYILFFFVFFSIQNLIAQLMLKVHLVGVVRIWCHMQILSATLPTNRTIISTYWRLIKVKYEDDIKTLPLKSKGVSEKLSQLSTFFGLPDRNADSLFYKRDQHGENKKLVSFIILVCVFVVQPRALFWRIYHLPYC